VVACTWPASAGLAAARGLPTLLGLHDADDHKRDVTRCYSAAPPGRPLPGHLAAVVAYVADTREQARQVLCRDLPRWLGPGLAGYRRPTGSLPGPRPARVRGPAVPHPSGRHPAAECRIEITATITNTGIRHLLCMAEGGGNPGRTLENIARLGAEALPAVRRHAALPCAPG
jgi:hypothetical protein